MTRRLHREVLWLVLLLLTPCAVGLGQELAIEDAAVYTSPDAPLRSHVNIVIHHGVIASVGEQVRIPKGIQTISCNGCVVLAGFWNAHVHFMEPKWNDAAHQPAERLTRQLSEMVTHSGFTTVVDTGSDVENTVALRKRLESGEVLGPRVFTAGIPLYPAHALPYYLADVPAEIKAKLGQPDTAEDAKSLVDKNRAAGADLLKLFTGSIVSPNRITPMKVEIARAAAEEEHKGGGLVFSHSSNLEGTKVAIDAGVDVLAHTPEVTHGIDEAVLRDMITRHMTIIPTLKLFSQDHDIAEIRGLDYRFHQRGGRLVYGTDTGFLPDYDQGEEFRQLMAAGFTFRDVLEMLTTAPAALFHLSQREGKVMPGMRGDLTVLSDDPASGGPEAFTKVRDTVRGGVVIWSADK
ncbi:amidohydrolase family protein [Terriglobus albidus]|uniref:amidohydrolase family protein n=1 Tax=Terriglobus albidus TaxID=1592106 RepID=UPI0021DF4A20|nr:amidohydrolase family protein [Terriglobus albidus]